MTTWLSRSGEGVTRCFTDAQMEVFSLNNHPLPRLRHKLSISVNHPAQKNNFGNPCKNGNMFSSQLTTTAFRETLSKKEAKTSNFEKLGQEKYTQLQA